jgi:hypothetical protein
MELKTDLLLNQIEKVDNHLIGILFDVVETVKNQDISNYPIIIAHNLELEIEIGIKLDTKHKSLDFRVSTLEELYVKNLVLKDNLEDFKNLYLNKKDKLCMLVLSEDKQEFVFVPKQRL